MDDMEPVYDDGSEALERADMADSTVRTYVIVNPAAPLEAEGVRTLRGNVTRSVDYLDGAKLVTWRFDESTF